MFGLENQRSKMSRNARYLICALALLQSIAPTFAQQNFSFRTCEEEEGRVVGQPWNLRVLEDGSWFVLTFKTEPMMGSPVPAFRYYLHIIDPTSLIPRVSKQWDFQSPWGKSAVENILVSNGKPYVLFTVQDQRENHLSVNVCPLDPITLERGEPAEIFDDSNAQLPKASGQQAMPLGFLSISNKEDNGWYIANLSYAFSLDSGLKKKWGGATADVKGIMPRVSSIIPDGKGSIIFVGGTGQKNKEFDPSELRIYKFDGTSTVSLPFKKLGLENAPLDLQTRLRPDGKLLCAGIYGRARANVYMGDEDTHGVYLGIFDVTKSDWDSFELLPMIQENEKPIQNLQITDIVVSPDNLAYCFVQQVSQSGSGSSRDDIWPVRVDVAGKPTLLTTLSYCQIDGLGSDRPSAILSGGKVRLLLNDTPKNIARRKEGKTVTKNPITGGSYKFEGQPGSVTWEPEGGITEDFPESDLWGGHRIMMGKLWVVGDGKWACWTPHLMKTAFGLIEAK